MQCNHHPLLSTTVLMVVGYQSLQMSVLSFPLLELYNLEAASLSQEVLDNKDNKQSSHTLYFRKFN